jgi:hypothetical protein
MKRMDGKQFCHSRMTCASDCLFSPVVFIRLHVSLEKEFVSRLTMSPRVVRINSNLVACILSQEEASRSVHVGSGHGDNEMLLQQLPGNISGISLMRKSDVSFY